MIRKIPSKQQQWDLLREKFSKVTDGLSHPIDNGILETVVALNVHELPTSGSCEGHIGWGLAGPWVDIEPVKSELIKKLIAQNREKYDHIEKRKKEKTPMAELEKDWEEYHRIDAEIRKPGLLLAKKLLNLLDEYYQGVPTIVDKQLVIFQFGRSINRLQSHGLIIQEVNSLEIQMLKLEEYQQEMQDFTAFLKKKFFEA